MHKMKQFFCLIALQLLILPTTISARGCFGPGTTEHPATNSTTPPSVTDDSSEELTDDDHSDEVTISSSAKPSTCEPTGSTYAISTESTSQSSNGDFTGTTTASSSEVVSTEATSEASDDISKETSTTSASTNTPSTQDPIVSTIYPTDGLTTITTVDSESTDATKVAENTTTTKQTTETLPTTEIAVDADRECQKHSGEDFIPHPTDCHKFIHCDGDRGFIKTCPSDLWWNEVVKTCDRQCVTLPTTSDV